MKKLIILLLTALIVMSCINNNNQSAKGKTKDENDKEEYNELNSDSTGILSQKEQHTPTLKKGEFIDIPLDSLLSFNSESALKKIFGENVKRSTGYYPEGMGEYNNSLLYPDSKNEVEFVWEDDSLNFSGLLYLELHGKNTDWKTKEGITIGTSMKELEDINKKPFTFYGLGWDYAGTIDWQEGYLHDRNIFGRLEYPEDTMPDEFKSLFGDHEIESSSKIAQKSNLILREITMRKRNK